MSTRALFHIQQNLTPARLRVILEAASIGGEKDLDALSQRCGLGANVLKSVVIPFVRQMGLLTERGMQLSEKGREFSRFARHHERLLGEAVHIYLYTLHSLNEKKYFSWAYAWLVERLWERGSAGLSGQLIGSLVGLLIEDAAARFGLSTARIAFSSSSVRGALNWLEALEPPVIFREGRHLRIARRHFCSPLPFLWAMDFLHRREGISYGVRLRLTPQRKDLLCQMCFLEPQGLENVLQMTKRTTDYERGGLFDYGTEGGLGLWLLLSQPCPVTHIPGETPAL